MKKAEPVSFFEDFYMQRLRFFFLIGKILKAAAGRNCASCNCRCIGCGISVCADQPYSIEGRNQTEPYA